MSREYCNVCDRPQVSCICQFIENIPNNINVVILQHPKEVNHTKGTVSLLSRSLQFCRVLIGEEFTDNNTLAGLLSTYHNRIALLYPSDNALAIQHKSDEKEALNHDIQCIILLDGTWKKAYRMYMMNKVLHNIPHLVLPEIFDSQYRVRATSKTGALSTLEACCYALSLLENNQNKYQPLLNNFNAFNQMLLSFNPTICEGK